MVSHYITVRAFQAHAERIHVSLLKITLIVPRVLPHDVLIFINNTFIRLFLVVVQGFIIRFGPPGAPPKGNDVPNLGIHDYEWIRLRLMILLLYASNHCNLSSLSTRRDDDVL